jgi:hypothetical protein
LGGIAIFLGHSYRLPKYELSSRLPRRAVEPKRSEVEGPAVESYSIKYKWKRQPSVFHPERSRGICSSAGSSWKCFRGSGLGFEARRVDCQTSAQPGRAGASIPQHSPSAVGAAHFSPQPASVSFETFPVRACRTADPHRLRSGQALGFTRGSQLIFWRDAVGWQKQKLLGFAGAWFFPCLIYFLQGLQEHLPLLDKSLT